jgi:hypothetical protein
MMRRIAFGLIALASGCMFWMLFDAERAPHELFTLDRRTILGLLAWFCVQASVEAGKVAFSSNMRGSE